MNLGTGIDILDKNRIKNIYLKFGENFINKILHSSEILEIQNASEERIISFLANRFCIKEAISKAIGGGISNKHLSFKDLIIKKNEFGQPFLVLNENILKSIVIFKEQILLKYNIINKISIETINFSISISDEKNLSNSIAILEFLEKEL